MMLLAAFSSSFRDIKEFFHYLCLFAEISPLYKLPLAQQRLREWSEETDERTRKVNLLRVEIGE